MIGMFSGLFLVSSLRVPDSGTVLAPIRRPLLAPIRTPLFVDKRCLIRAPLGDTNKVSQSRLFPFSQATRARITRLWRG